ncbi:geranylgeranyl reductase family protein [Desulfomonile tiedjei]|uniref:Geranylgeranyl reductase family protein n=1 Tax=Desulfomonile tiedjei (strain ATCC 49306 / DSM 6799 / DCB-1) TaxID=706587 RepID=I4C093_DESTA|nr:NAD(P)/FAD-dependent oxidoreductase [Desulfomonile tiedjei]AFM22984.1 geranylgeranyl reductase family protein [Desulfomonile tiedjei DSM 6799]
MGRTIACDVLVVGAGPAGSSAARAAAEMGVDTVLIDAKMRIGEQPHCGEFVPSRLFGEFHLDKSCIIQSVDSMETRILTGLSEFGPDLCIPAMTTVSPGHMIDRVRFDRDLARKASESGARVFSGTRLIRHKNDYWIARAPESEISFFPRIVIAADGPLSSVGSLLGLPSFQFLKGLQVEVPLAESIGKTIIFLDKAFSGGYGWLFPKGIVANLGIGARPDTNVRDLLRSLASALITSGMIREGILARYGGIIPVSGLRPSLCVENVIFCGDAAGLTHPVTGAGIPQAVFSGDLAGRAASAAIKNSSDLPIREYEAEVRGRYKGVIDHAVSKRTIMGSWKTGTDTDYVKLCEQTWIAFKGYRQRIRNVSNDRVGQSHAD